MSEILARWLTDEVSVSRPVRATTIDRDLSNGYLFGELLFKYTVIPSLTGLEDGFVPFLSFSLSFSLSLSVCVPNVSVRLLFYSLPYPLSLSLLSMVCDT